MKSSYRKLCAVTAVICGAWFVLLGSGCDYDYVPPPKPQETELAIASPGLESNRFTIEIVATFPDDLAYRQKRGVYIIRDHQTGAEYVGVSGIGITETGSHKSGKSTVRDER